MREVCGRGISYTAEPSPQPFISRCPWLSLLMMAWISQPSLADSKFCDLVKLLKSPVFHFLMEKVRTLFMALLRINLEGLLYF